MEGLDDGVLVQEQVEGTDHRLLSVKGKFVAALQRVPAYVDGNGTDTIKTLIGRENDTIVRLDNARSPLCKIKIDDDLLDFLKKQDLSIESVPGDGERITLRRVANISAGGVSINVTDKIHPANMKLVEDISSFFNVACMGIDVLCDDIANPWTGGNFGIIEINAGPGVFMHLAPAIGGAIDVPAKIIDAHFPGEHFERVPIIAGNALTTDLCRSIYGKLKELRADVVFGSLTDEGVHFNGEYFFRNGRHDQNVKIVLRRQDLDFAAFNHTKEDIWDFGLFHQGADVVVLENPGDAEEAILRDLLPDGHLVVVRDSSVAVLQDGKEVASYPIEEGKEEAILKAIEPLLHDLLMKYE
jgi:cyanophycin synthetase